MAIRYSNLIRLDTIRQENKFTKIVYLYNDIISINEYLPEAGYLLDDLIFVRRIVIKFFFRFRCETRQAMLVNVQVTIFSCSICLLKRFRDFSPHSNILVSCWVGPWCQYSGQCSGFLLRWFEFVSRWLLNFSVKLCCTKIRRRQDAIV